MVASKPQPGQRYKDSHGHRITVVSVEFLRVTFYRDGYEHPCVQPLERFERDYQLVVGVRMINATCQKEVFFVAVGHAEGFSVVITREGEGLLGVTTRAKEGFSDITTRAEGFSYVTGARTLCNSTRAREVEFSESIKKGSISNATLDSTGQSAKSHFGHSFGFLRCSSLSFRPQASSTQAEKLALGFSGFSRSTLASISSISSCGKRIPFKLDLLLTFLVAIGFSPRWCVSTIHKSGGNKILDVLEHLRLWCSNTLSTGKAQATHKIATPRSGGTQPRRLTTNVKYSNEVAMSDHTTPLTGRNSLTPNKFTWRFLAISRSDRNAKPCRMSVEAQTEREARQVLAPHFILSLAARLPDQEVSYA